MSGLMYLYIYYFIIVYRYWCYIIKTINSYSFRFTQYFYFYNVMRFIQVIFLKINIELGADFMSLRDEALEMHKRNQGKLEVKPNVKVTNKEELSLAYSPGVAEPCKDIYEDKRKVYDYTIEKGIQLQLLLMEQRY